MSAVNLLPPRFSVQSVSIAAPSNPLPPVALPPSSASATFVRSMTFSKNHRLEAFLYNNTTPLFVEDNALVGLPFHSGSFHSFANASPMKLHKISVGSGMHAPPSDYVLAPLSVLNARLSIYVPNELKNPVLFHVFPIPRSLLNGAALGNFTDIWSTPSFEAALNLPAGLIHVCIELYRNGALTGSGIPWLIAPKHHPNPQVHFHLSF